MARPRFVVPSQGSRPRLLPAEPQRKRSCLTFFVCFVALGVLATFRGFTVVFRLARLPEASFDWYQPNEAARLIEGATTAWERAVLMFPLHTGARMGEQRAIRSSQRDDHRVRIVEPG